MTWTDERIEELKKLWSEGLSASAIGDRLGITKNAVVGKAHRLKLASRPSPIKRDGGSGAARRASRQKSLATPRREPARASGHAPVQKREAKAPSARHPSPQQRRTRPVRRSADSGQGCLWPIGDPGDADFHFCGAERSDGRPYCADHVRRAYITRNKDSEAA